MSSATVASIPSRIEYLSNHSPLFKRLLKDLDAEKIAIIAQPLEQAILPDKNWVPALDSLDLDACMRYLRQYKQQGLRHIIWWELGLHADIRLSWRSISDLADALIGEALRMAIELIAPRFGYIHDGQFSVIGLGKLGGQELNIGSDVDLLFLWRANISSEGGRKSMPPAEYYAHVSRMLIRLLDEHNGYGQVWPVDMRLRPGGHGFAICLSLEGTLTHYLEYGQTWERAMLIKARHVAGANELGQKFLEELAPFKFRRYLDFTTVTALAEMKGRIDRGQQQKTPGVGFDVKRGYGGIREVEFVVQALQLLHGGRTPALRHSIGTLAALQVLQQHHLITASDAETLTEGYIFWRQVEHAIQARNGEQTQVLPDDYQSMLSALLTMDHATEAMMAHAEAIHTVFAEQLLPESEKKSESPSWLTIETTVAQQQAIKLSMDQIEQYLQRGLLPERSKAQIDVFLAQAMPIWLQDDNGLQAMDAFAELIHAIAGRATWIDLLATHQGTSRWLIGVLSASRYVASHIVRDPSWLEWPLSYERGGTEISRLCAHLQQLDVQMDDAALLAELGRCVDHGRLHCALSIDAHEQDALTIARWLSEIADAATDACIRYNISRLALPSDFPLVALAMGKHGSREMGLVSDLDMVFVLVADDDRQMLNGRAIRDWAQRLGRRVIHTLSSDSPFGAGYQFDARLRPSGNHGVLVTGLTSFQDYQLNEAQAWEHQALCRARAVAGPEQAQKSLMQCVDNILAQQRDIPKLAREVQGMRQKMLDNLSSKDSNCINLKQDKGGLVDIEFMGQFSRLAFGDSSQGTVDTLRNIPAHAPAGWQQQGKTLADTYLAYREMENALRTELWQSIGKLPHKVETSEWKTLGRHCQITTPEQLLQRMQQVHQYFVQWMQIN